MSDNVVFENGLPNNSVIIGYRNFEFVFLDSLLMMMDDSLSVLRSDEELHNAFVALRERVNSLCDFPEPTRNLACECVVLDVD